MGDRVGLDGYTASLCGGSCRKNRLETKMVCNVFSNKIEITCSIHKGLYFMLYKNHHESLKASRILVFRLTMTWSRLIHCSNLRSSYVGPGLFALLSIAGFFLILRLFVAFSFTIGAKDLFSMAVHMRKVGDMSITLLKLSRSIKCRTNTYWQCWIGLTIQVESEFPRESNQIMLHFWYSWLFAHFLLHRLVQPWKKEHNFYLSRIVGLIPNLCFEGIELSKKHIIQLIGRFYSFRLIKPWSMDPLGAIF